MSFSVSYILGASTIFLVNVFISFFYVSVNGNCCVGFCFWKELRSHVLDIFLFRCLSSGLHQRRDVGGSRIAEPVRPLGFSLVLDLGSSLLAWQLPFPETSTNLGLS